MKVHLVDATFELFRAYYSPGRSLEHGPDGRPVNAVHGLIDSMLSLLREPDVTHIAAATDFVIESWRNDRIPTCWPSSGTPNAPCGRWAWSPGRWSRTRPMTASLRRSPASATTRAWSR